MSKFKTAKQRISVVSRQFTVHWTKISCWGHKTKRDTDIYRLLSRYTSSKMRCINSKLPNKSIRWIFRQFTVTLNENELEGTIPRGGYWYAVYCRGTPLAKIRCRFFRLSFSRRTFFQVAKNPRDNTHPLSKGDPLTHYIRLHIYIYKCVFSRFGIFSSSGHGSFLVLSARGTQGARPDPIRKFGPRPRSAARALGVESGKSARGGIPST